jgi:hypothetical protein
LHSSIWPRIWVPRRFFPPKPLPRLLSSARTSSLISLPFSTSRTAHGSGFADEIVVCVGTLCTHIFFPFCYITFAFFTFAHFTPRPVAIDPTHHYTVPPTRADQAPLRPIVCNGNGSIRR